MKINCEHTLCIYEKQGTCMLDEIAVNSVGMCSECIIAVYDFDELEIIKKDRRDFFNKIDEEL